MRVRRVVTGQTATGKSVFVSDDQVEPTTLELLPGAEFHRLWGGDEPVALPTDGAMPAAPRYFPPASGFRFAFFTLGPDNVTTPPDLDIPSALRELAEKLPGLGEAMEPANPGMHTTDTVSTSTWSSPARCGWSSTTGSSPACARATPSCRTAPATAGSTAARRPPRSRSS